jgi:hypothetical protein
VPKAVESSELYIVLISPFAKYNSLGPSIIPGLTTILVILIVLGFYVSCIEQSTVLYTDSA